MLKLLAKTSLRELGAANPKAADKFARLGIAVLGAEKCASPSQPNKRLLVASDLNSDMQDQLLCVAKRY